jgi:hypothetical protein
MNQVNQPSSGEATGIEAEVCRDIALRQIKGIAKYGQTVADNPLNLKEWLQHTYEESLDLPIYLKRAIREQEQHPTPPAGACPQCDGKGWYAVQNCSSHPWEAEQKQCEACHGTGKSSEQAISKAADIIAERLLADRPELIAYLRERAASEERSSKEWENESKDNPMAAYRSGSSNAYLDVLRRLELNQFKEPTPPPSGVISAEDFAWKLLEFQQDDYDDFQREIQFITARDEAIRRETRLETLQLTASMTTAEILHHIDQLEREQQEQR